MLAASMVGMVTIYIIGTTYLALYLLLIILKPDTIGIAIKQEC